MAQLRVRGIVKLTNRVRDALARGLSAGARDDLRREVVEGLEQLDLAMEDHGLTSQAMSPAARKAYAFLKGVDFDAVATSDDLDDGPYAPGTVRLPGLRRFVRDLLDRLAQPLSDADGRDAHTALRAKADAVEELMDAECIRPEHLKDESRHLRGWLRYFADAEHFDTYLSAVGRARGAFEARAAASRAWPAPMNIHLCPMKALYRLRHEGEATRVCLPTPMITFSREAFDALAGMALRKGPRRRLVEEQMLAPAYQDALAELEFLTGGARPAGGVFHDLGASFERVRAAYFDAQLARPRLVWSRTLTARKFGHHDAVHDTVMISATLDAESVPEFVVDFVLYHELLHKRLGVTWRNGRRGVHTGEFRRAERRFARYDEAKAVLDRLARAR